ncbi:hypothetical protein [Pseudomonas fluorescens]|uniref:hypothetical protein n=1 Tax=Pseudomonas fluorescens TaxID=294 RepID=UPI0007D0A464|nr:hypothetical protein [Pseudomonas fluorescens]
MPRKTISLALKFFTLDPNTGLENQILFWLAIGIPALIAILLGIPVWLPYAFSFTPEGYSKFLEISKLPIGILSLSIPLGVLIGKLHGAKQTAAQIQNTKIQIQSTDKDNKTKLYISHFEHFCKNIDFIESSLKIRYSNILSNPSAPIINKPSLYRICYPSNSIHLGVTPMSEEFKSLIKCRLKQLDDALKDLVFLPKNDDTKASVEALRKVEITLFLVQDDAANCLDKLNSIFIKSSTIEETLKDSFYYGVNKEAGDYKKQASFLAQLIEGIESIETLNPKDRVANDFFMGWRTHHPYFRPQNDKIEKRIGEILPHTQPKKVGTHL